MSGIILFDTGQITVSYLPEKKIIYHTVHKPVNGQALRDALAAGSEALAKYGVCKWLSDDRKNGPLPPEDVEWGSTYCHPRMIEAGWKYWAVVVPEELISAGSMISVIEELYELGLRVMVFSRLEDAEQWLDEQ